MNVLTASRGAQTSFYCRAKMSNAYSRFGRLPYGLKLNGIAPPDVLMDLLSGGALILSLVGTHVTPLTP